MGTKISQLPAASTPTGVEEIPLVQSSTTKKSTLASFATWIATLFPTLTSLAAPSGSSLVGFTQVGTGAVSETVQAQLRQTVTAMQFGAKGDGTTDDTVAIQNAINSIASGLVILPPTACLTTATLILPAQVGLLGQGGLSGINYTPSIAGTAIQMGATATAALNYGMSLRDLEINLFTANSTGVHIISGAKGVYSNVRVASNSVNQGMTGWKIDGYNYSAFFNLFENTFAEHCHIGYWFTTTGSTPPTQQTFVGTSATGDVANSDSTGVAYLFDQNCGEDSTFVGGDIESWGTGISMPTQMRYTKWFGTRFESNTADVNIADTTSSGNTFIGVVLRDPVTDNGNSLWIGVSSTTLIPALNTYFTGTYTGTATGMTTTITATVKYTIIGNVVTLDIPTFSGTSNATTFTITGAPALLNPNATKYFYVSTVDNSGANVMSIAAMVAGTITLSNGPALSTAFTNSGTKQLAASSVSYTLQ